jgi:hypothetical protein
MITVVTGPPCGGKSTFIDENANTGDCVIDMDRVALALTFGDVGHHDYDDRIRFVARSARNAAVKSALSAAQGERRWGVWIIHTDPEPNIRAMYRAHGSRIVECNPGKAECLRRLSFRPVSNQRVARKVIDEYFAIR